MKVAVIGSGPGGFAAARRAAELGAEVTIVEKDKVGGVCLNKGCIPTKKLLEFAKRDFKSSWYQTLCEKENLIESGRENILGHLKLNQIKLVQGETSFEGPKVLRIKSAGQKAKIKADRIIIATGSSDIKLKIFDYQNPGILTSKEALNLKEVPESLIIVGGGVVGLEFATIFSSLGTKVTIVESMETLLPGEDPRMVKEITQILKNQGVEIFTGTGFQKLQLQAEKTLVAVGRTPNSQNLKLEKAGVKTDQKGFISVNEKMETNVKGIYAVGDVVGKYFLAPVAALEGEVAAENALGNEAKIDYAVIPRSIFTNPPIGFCGLNSSQSGYQTKVGRAYFKNNAAAQIRGETKGFLQIVADRDSDKILGAQIIGLQAPLLIQEVAVAMKQGVTCQELAKTCHIHPTLAEIIPQACQNAERRR